MIYCNSKQRINSQIKYLPRLNMLSFSCFLNFLFQILRICLLWFRKSSSMKCWTETYRKVNNLLRQLCALLSKCQLSHNGVVARQTHGLVSQPAHSNKEAAPMPAVLCYMDFPSCQHCWPVCQPGSLSPSCTSVSSVLISLIEFQGFLWSSLGECRSDWPVVFITR